MAGGWQDVFLVAIAQASEVSKLFIRHRLEQTIIIGLFPIGLELIRTRHRRKNRRNARSRRRSTRTPTRSRSRMSSGKRKRR
jgi:hypothetical protein